jgi:hypothetical protein
MASWRKPVVWVGNVKEKKAAGTERRERADKEGKAKSRRVSSVEAILFQLSGEGWTAWRVASTGMLDIMKDMPVSEEPEDIKTILDGESVDDDELPTWAKRSSFTHNELGRIMTTCCTPFF